MYRDPKKTWGFLKNPRDTKKSIIYMGHMGYPKTLGIPGIQGNLGPTLGLLVPWDPWDPWGSRKAYPGVG